MSDQFASQTSTNRTVTLVKTDELDKIIATLPGGMGDFVKRAGFKAGLGECLILPSDSGPAALFGIGASQSPFDAGGAAMTLPEGDWTISRLPAGWDATQTLIALTLGGYQFTRYKSPSRQAARFHVEGADRDDAARIVEGAFLTRDLVNTPAEDMLPSHLEAVARDLAKTHKASVTVTKGDALLKNNYPLIHAVGRASDNDPRLIEIEWGEKDAPRLALVGKGVCFDSGGLDIKGAAGMLIMKKDMGGAANVLGLASMIMSAGLKVRLHVLLPAVENAISGNAFRPGDILPSRKGLTVEIGNTDAEGRLVLADAITKACEHDPELVIDMATLTGAARVALGPELPPYYCDNDDLADAVFEASKAVDDPVWRMPLWDGYDEQMDGQISDLSSTGSGRMAGSITAALFLRRFGADAKAWMHFDIYAWNPKSRPGHPAGGEMQASRALYHWLKETYPA